MRNVSSLLQWRFSKELFNSPRRGSLFISSETNPTTILANHSLLLGSNFDSTSWVSRTELLLSDEYELPQLCVYVLLSGWLPEPLSSSFIRLFRTWAHSQLNHTTIILTKYSLPLIIIIAKARAFRRLIRTSISSTNRRTALKPLLPANQSNFNNSIIN